MRNGMRIAKPCTPVRWKTSTACSVPTSFLYMRLFVPSASASTDCANSSARNSNSQPSQYKRQAGSPPGPPAFFDFPGLGFVGLYAVGCTTFLAPRETAYFFSKRSIRPAVSINFWRPVKHGWHAEQISTRMSPLWVERVLKVWAHAQVTLISLEAVCIPAFILLPRGSFREFQYTRNVNPPCALRHTGVH